MTENNCRGGGENSCGCPAGAEIGPATQNEKNNKWIIGEAATAEGIVPIVSTRLAFKDISDSWKARWGIGRMNYRINPGLYAAGNPDIDSPVLVSANYKLTFDKLRKELTGLNCWILILDTDGVNVWCAAGKGTFGTDEIVSRISQTKLDGVVTHRKLILPQLAAPGVCANEVKAKTGFNVLYGPVRARDIKAFINSGFKATKEMRTVKFTARDRLALAPMELVTAAKISLLIFGIMFLINLFAARPFGVADFTVYAAAVLTGTVLTPVLLPFVPGRPFAFKGWLLSVPVTALIVWLFGWFSAPFLLTAIGYMLAMPALSAFLALNFTGSSTYTSFSGVIKEMKIAIPLIFLSLGAGIILILIKAFVG